MKVKGTLYFMVNLGLLVVLFTACNQKKNKSSRHKTQPSKAEIAWEQSHANQKQSIESDQTSLPTADAHANTTPTVVAKDRKAGRLSHKKRNKKAERKRTAALKKNRLKATMAIYDQTGVPTEHFTIDNTKESVVLAEKGTLISIPRNCFQTPSGKSVKGPITLVVKEVFTKSDLLLSNVPTISNGKLLESNGSVYIGAQSNGEDLELMDGKSVYVELPTTNSNREMLVFNGDFDSRGNMNWIPTGKLSKVMYTLPFETLKLKVESMNDETYQRIIQGGNENTFLATRAFKNRVNFLEETADLHNRTDEIIEFYIRNNNLSLMEVDDKIIDYFNGLSKCYPYVEQDKKENKGVFKARKRYKDFYDEKLTRADLIYTYNVDLDSETAYQDLMEKGMESSKADKIMQHHATRKALIAENEKTRKARLQRLRERGRRLKSDVQDFAQNNFEIQDLGWINVDRFAKYPATTRLLVNMLKPENVYAEAFLVFETRQSVASGVLDNSGEYCVFNRLPKGDQVHLVVFGHDDSDQPYLHTEEIVLGEQENIEVRLMPASIAKLEEQAIALN